MKVLTDLIAIEEIINKVVDLLKFMISEKNMDGAGILTEVEKLMLKAKNKT